MVIQWIGVRVADWCSSQSRGAQRKVTQCSHPGTFGSVLPS